MASDNAVGRFANREAARCLERALTLTSELDEGDRWETELLLLDELGHLRRSMGDMRGSGEAFLSSAALADSHGRPGQMVESLILAASASSWFDRSACLAMAGRAEAHARILDAGIPAARPRLRGLLAPSLGPLAGRRSAARARRRRTAVSRRRVQTRRVDLLARHVFARLVGSDYEGSRRPAAVGAELARRRGDAFGLLVAQFYRVWASVAGRRVGRSRADLQRESARRQTQQARPVAEPLPGDRAWLLRETSEPRRRRRLSLRPGAGRPPSRSFCSSVSCSPGLQLGLTCLGIPAPRRRSRRARGDRSAAGARAPADGLELADAVESGSGGVWRSSRAAFSTPGSRAGLVGEAAAPCGERGAALTLGSLTLAETMFGSGAIDASPLGAGRRRPMLRRPQRSGAGGRPSRVGPGIPGSPRHRATPPQAPLAAKPRSSGSPAAWSKTAPDSPLARSFAEANHVRLAAALP